MKTYRQEAFKHILDRFSKKVRENEYKPLDKGVWFMLKDLTARTNIIDVHLNDSIMHVRFLHDDRRYSFSIHDESFGSFLHDGEYDIRKSDFDDETPKANVDNEIWFTRDILKDIIRDFKQCTGCFLTDNEKSKLTIILKEDDVMVSVANSSIMISTTHGCQFFPIKPNSFGEHMYKLYFSPKISQLTEAFDKLNDSAQEAKKSFSWLNDVITINSNNRKEENNMNNFINFDFGVMNTSALHMSMYGPAVYNKNNGKYYAYDKENDRMMDVSPINFKMDNMFYKMPTSISALQKGDMIIHVNTPMCVSHVCLELNEIEVIDYFSSEKKIIKPVCNMFGFDYYTKVVCLLDNFKTEADEDNPFGNMWMLAAAGSDGSNMLPLMMLMNKDAANFDPMMMMLLCSKDMSNNDLLPLLLLQSGRLIK